MTNERYYLNYTPKRTRRYRQQAKPIPTKKIKRQKKLPASQYKSYIRSKRWLKRLRRYYTSHDAVCVICSSTVELNLHHKTYERLGFEKDEDLVPLCGPHHEDFHESIGGSKLDMIKETDQYIEAQRTFLEQDNFLRSI